MLIYLQSLVHSDHLEIFHWLQAEYDTMIPLDSDFPIMGL
jgi:hypothetical protein